MTEHLRFFLNGMIFYATFSENLSENKADIDVMGWAEGRQRPPKAKDGSE